MISTTTTTTSQEEELPHDFPARSTIASRDDWRRFAEEKRDMTRRFNDDRAALAAENHRMRLVLSGKPPSTTNTEEKKNIIRLTSDLSSERMLKKAAEQQVTELALQLHNLRQGADGRSARSLAVVSATAAGETALGKQLERALVEIEALRRERKELDGQNLVSWVLHGRLTF